MSSGCTLGGSAIRQNGFRRAGQAAAPIARHFANFINAISTASGPRLRQASSRFTSHSFGQRLAVPRVQRNCPRPNRFGPRCGDRRSSRRRVRREVGHRSDPDARPQPGVPRLESDFFQPAQGEQHECGLSLVFLGARCNRRIIPPVAAVWVQRFPDGHGGRDRHWIWDAGNSSQIAFSSGPQSYLGQAPRCSGQS